MSKQRNNPPPKEPKPSQIPIPQIDWDEYEKNAVREENEIKKEPPKKQGGFPENELDYIIM